MRTDRLVSTTEPPVRPAIGRLPVADEGEPRRVEAAEVIEGDRQRSLREELNEAEAGERARKETRRLATRLVELPPEAQAQLARPLLPGWLCVVDEKA